tara:strand:- start:336 stop:503 length:168 start_codon:yes stop_codon:yes gene_type:complete
MTKQDIDFMFDAVYYKIVKEKGIYAIYVGYQFVEYIPVEHNDYVRMKFIIKSLKQ